MAKAKAVKFMTIAQRLGELEGLTLQEISDLLGYKDKGSCKCALYYLKQQGKIDYKAKRGIYSHFKLLDEKALKQFKEAAESTELINFRTWLAVSNAYRLNSLIEAKGLKPKEELEAIRELGRIERGLTSPTATHYARLIEEQLGLTNPWQTKKP